MKNFINSIATIVFFSSLVLVPSDDASITTYVIWLVVILSAGYIFNRKEHEAK